LRRRLAALVLLLGVAGGLVAGCSDDEGGSVEEFCAQLPDAPSLADLVDDLDTVEPEQLETQLSRGADQFDELQDASPDAIRDDVGRVADAVDEVLEVVQDNVDDRDALRAELAERKARLLQAGPPAQRLVDYARDACDVDLGG
jgi:hypothetical protein